MDLSVRHQPADPLSIRHEPAMGTALGIGKETLSAPLQEAVKEVQVQTLKVITAEAAAEAWKELESWQPKEEKTPAENVRDLRERYRAWKSYILETKDAALRAQLLAQLDSLVTGHLETLLDGPYGALIAFLIQNKQTLAALAIKNSLLLFVLGTARKVPIEATQPGRTEAERTPERAGRTVSRESPGGAPHASTHGVPSQHAASAGRETQQTPAGREAQQTPADRTADHGMLQYGPDGKKGTRAPDARVLSLPEAETFDASTSARTSGVVLTYTPKGHSAEALFPKPFTLVELEQANAFARHMSQYGGTGPLPPASVEREEWIGLRAGVLWLKGQVFAKADGVSKTTAHLMQNTAEHQIAASIRQAAMALKSGSAFGPAEARRFAPLEQEAVFSVYHHVIRGYTKNRDPIKALLSSIFFMAERVKEKAEDPAYRGIHRYQDGRAQGEPRAGTSPQLAMKQWVQQLRGSWNQFVSDMGLRKDLSLDIRRFQTLNGVWATAPATAAKPGRTQRALPLTLLGWCGVGAVLAALALFLWVQ